MNTKPVVYILFISSCCGFLVSCRHLDSDVKKRVLMEEVAVSYKEVELDWSTNSFCHNNFSIFIPEKWGYGILGKRDKFYNYDPHDIKFAYNIFQITTYGGDTFVEASFKELVKMEPSSKDKIFEINTVNINIDSKIMEKDELINDYYFKYDFNPDFYNFCYFKIAKNDVQQLNNGYYNQINVKLKYLEHFDDALSFVIRTKDGLNNIGDYSEVSISHNPENLESN